MAHSKLSSFAFHNNVREPKQTDIIVIKTKNGHLERNVEAKRNPMETGKSLSLKNDMTCRTNHAECAL